MEDSAKRRERLQAMRMEASSSSTDRPSPSFSTPYTPLSNPLIYPSVPSVESSPSPHRFDYYTDPTAAYSSSGKNMNKKTGHPGHGSYFRPPIYSSPIHSASAVGYTAAQPQFAGQQTEYHICPTNTPRAHQVPSPNTPFLGSKTGLLTSPNQYTSPASGNGGAPHNLPRPWNMSGNSSEHSLTPNSSNGCGQSSFRPMNSPYSGIRGSPHSHPGGRGGHFRGRGGSHNQAFGSGRPKKLDSFFIKSLVKDPWRKLKPVVGNILVPLKPLPWLPKSITTKKLKVDETSTDIKATQNLAEFLALAFEESTSNEQEGEGSLIPNPKSEY